MITSKGAIYLFDTLTKLEAEVSEINLNGNPIDNLCLDSLGNYLADNNSLKWLHIAGNENVGYDIEANPDGLITDEGLEILAPYLLGNVALETLGLSCHPKITSASIDNLKDLVNKTKIRKINLFGTSISSHDNHQLRKLLAVDPEHRQIPIHSTSKSASKSHR